MDNLIKDFNLLGLASLAVAIVVLVAFTRRLVELLVPSLVKKEVTSAKQKMTEYTHQWSRFYNELILYLLPYIWAGLLAIPNIEFVFQGAGTSYAGRALLACLVATFSGLFYKSVKKSIPALFGVQVETSDKLFELPPKE